MNHVIIVAGGNGKRMNSTIPKQFMLLAGKPVLMHTILRFHEADPELNLVVVLPERHLATWDNLKADHNFTVEHQTVAGGETRFHSVKNGLAALPEVTSPSIIAVHDGVRPLVSNDLIRRCFGLALDQGVAVPSLPMKETVRQIIELDTFMLPRESLRLIQTPQCFKADAIKAAFSVNYSEAFSDCASVVEASGIHITLTEGEDENIKITTMTDLWLAEQILKSKAEQSSNNI
jgi:2-C-methyl-D-erythritol 4-phosphate cytidylyltransferase